MTPLMSRRQAVRLGFALVIALALVTALAALYRIQIMRVLLPLFLWEIEWLGDDFRITGIALKSISADLWIGVDAGLARPVVIAGKIMFPDPGLGMTVFTLAGYVLETLIVFIGVALAWPLKGWREGLLRFLTAIPILLVALMIDVPLVLLAALWKGILNDLGDHSFHPLLAWENFLSYGGRLGLALFACAACVALARRLAVQRLPEQPVCPAYSGPTKPI
jgi:hypothetical protein